MAPEGVGRNSNDRLSFIQSDESLPTVLPAGCFVKDEVVS
jgi:hypothetical protein